MAAPPPGPSANQSPEPGLPRTPSDADPTTLPPVPVLSPLLARRLNARVLDPETAVLAPGESKPLPTVYVSDTLLVRDVAEGSDADRRHPSRVDELRTFAQGLPEPVTIDVLGDPVLVPYRGDAPDSLAPGAHVTVTRVRLGRSPEQAGKAPDAWRFLQSAVSVPSERAAMLHDKLGLGRLPEGEDGLDDAERRRRERRGRRARSMAGGVSVEHVLTAGGGVWGAGGGVWGAGGGVWGAGGGVWGAGGGVWGAGGLFTQYGTPGVGGRTPVVVPVHDPRRSADIVSDPPVVAVLDTGLGEHPWFPRASTDVPAEQCQHPCPGAHRRVTFRGETLGVWRDPTRDPEGTGVVIDDVNGLTDGLCGHGTFVAGVIRQRCPAAVILSVPVMASDGAALEDDVVAALSSLLERHRAAEDAEDPVAHSRIDVVNLSLGYYHETPEDADDTALSHLLQEFADEGIVVVACAGNDATRARFFPAAFATRGRDALVGVGATNPDDHTIALFSNVGDWVTAHAPGAGIISTVPVTLSGSLTAGVYVEGHGPGPRAGVDFDDYRSGFALWSGTSFASPWIAGEVAAEIARTASTAAATGSSRALAAAATVVARANEIRFGRKDAPDDAR